MGASACAAGARWSRSRWSRWARGSQVQVDQGARPADVTDLVPVVRAGSCCSRPGPRVGLEHLDGAGPPGLRLLAAPTPRRTWLLYLPVPWTDIPTPAGPRSAPGRRLPGPRGPRRPAVRVPGPVWVEPESQADASASVPAPMFRQMYASLPQPGAVLQETHRGRQRLLSRTAPGQLRWLGLLVLGPDPVRPAAVPGALVAARPAQHAHPHRTQQAARRRGEAPGVGQRGALLLNLRVYPSGRGTL